MNIKMVGIERIHDGECQQKDPFGPAMGIIRDIVEHGYDPDEIISRINGFIEIAREDIQRKRQEDSAKSRIEKLLSADS
jgi:hypothetical protein